MARSRWLGLAFLLDAAGIVLFVTPAPGVAIIVAALAFAVVGNFVGATAQGVGSSALGSAAATTPRALFAIATVVALAALAGLALDDTALWPAFAVPVAGAAQAAAWATLPLAQPERAPRPAHTLVLLGAMLLLFTVAPLASVPLDLHPRGDALAGPLRDGALHAIRPATAVLALAIHGLLCGYLRPSPSRPAQTRWLLQLADIATWGALGLLALIPLALDATAAADAILVVMCLAGVGALVVAVWRLQLLRHRTSAALVCTPAIALLASIGPSFMSSMFGFVLTAVPLTAAVVWAAMARRGPLASAVLDPLLIAAGVALAALHGPVATPSDVAIWSADQAWPCLPWLAGIVARALYLAALAHRIRLVALRRDAVPTATALR